MIVPRARLLFWTAVIGLPFAFIAVIEPAALGFAFVAIAGLAVITLIDAAMSYGRLRGIAFELPEVVRLTKDREGEVPITIHNETAREHELRVGLAFPREILTERPDVLTMAPAGAVAARVSWPITPVRRGNYPLDRVYVEGTSPLGFWSVRGSRPVQSELRVYPNLLSERRRLAAIFLNRGSFGMHAQRQVGQGREFEKLREYIPGDSFEDVHWKATAKRGKPITKMYQIERTQEVYVIIDTSRLSARTVRMETNGVEGDVSYLERFITASLILGMVAERQGDLFGLVTFGDKIHSFVRAKTGRAHFDTCRDALYTLEPQVVNPDFDELFTFLRLRLRRRALLLFLTNLDDTVLKESFVKNIEMVRRQHLCLVGMMTPPRVRPLFTDPQVETSSDIYQHLAGHLMWHDLREVDRVLQRMGVGFFLLDNERMCAEIVTQYTNVKQRQLI
ncbi:MAG: DUF58 domain-containing protein [Candidatus Hydrogenedentes bacterium]|nr:DUF58 domain-containing protein [Candidatus Hydrogenedentota bacterium]